MSDERQRRIGPTVALAALAAVAGGAVALGIGAAAGWLGAGETVVLASQARRRHSLPRPPEPQSVPAPEPPQAQGAFDPAALYRERAPGVVTIYARFRITPARTPTPRARDRDSSSRRTGYVLTNSHVITTAGAGDVAADAVEAATRSTSSSRTATASEAEIVGWDLFNDIGLLKVDPADHALAAGAARGLGGRRRRRAGGGDRKPVRPGELARRRRRLGDSSARSSR